LPKKKFAVSAGQVAAEMVCNKLNATRVHVHSIHRVHVPLFLFRRCPETETAAECFPAVDN
jgi:hypothetical protein